MVSNVGGSERVIRILLGVILIVLAAARVVAGNLALAAYVVGGIALITGLIRYCPAWSIFGVNTCPAKTKEAK